jgi:uncharacterized protein (DUF433 family)
MGGQNMFDRIVFQPGVLGGKPIVRGTRISVEFILELIADGGSITEIAQNYPMLTEEDIRQAIQFAAAALKNDQLHTVAVA